MSRDGWVVKTVNDDPDIRFMGCTAGGACCAPAETAAWLDGVFHGDAACPNHRDNLIESAKGGLW